MNLKSTWILIVVILSTLICFCESTEVSNNQTTNNDTKGDDDPKANSYGAVLIRNIVGGVVEGVAEGTKGIPILGDATKAIYCIFGDFAALDKLLENTLFAIIAEVVGAILGPAAGEAIWKIWKTLEAILITAGDAIGGVIASLIKSVIQTVLKGTPLGDEWNKLMGKGGSLESVTKLVKGLTTGLRTLSSLLLGLGAALTKLSHQIASIIIQVVLKASGVAGLVDFITSLTSIHFSVSIALNIPVSASLNTPITGTTEKEVVPQAQEKIEKIVSSVGKSLHSAGQKDIASSVGKRIGGEIKKSSINCGQSSSGGNNKVIDL